ncbi:MAG TPA: amino acid--tRNA ligase-related protein, partial [Spongiibacteraceae bacterium]
MSEERNSIPQDENKLIAERRAKLHAIRQQRNAFPNSFRRDSYAENLQKEFGEKSKEELEALHHKAKVAGRIMAMRGPFLVLQDMTGRIQAYVDKNKLPEDLLQEIKTWDIGDIIGAEGPVHKSGKGDLYVYLEKVALLTKSLRPLPDKYHGLQDQEMRYRQRYIDLIMNEDVRRNFRIRSQLIDGIRDYLTDRDFLEVETPMMQAIPGGASAKPFVTFHNALDLEMFLRISPELYLKRLVVGGMERVFEINRNFRNEGLSTRHNPEFTMIEFYQAYADHNDLMDLTEDMLRYLANRILGKTLLDYQGKQFEFGKPFARLSVFDSILHFNPDIKAEQLQTMDGAKEIAKRLNIHLKETWGLGKVQ